MISCMNKPLITFFLTLLLPVTITAQTYYYKLTKKVQNGTTSTKVSGGQFVTFMADICYESNKKGIGVGHGTLQRNKNFSNSQFKVYMGKSYWGSDATFKFTSDLNTLNVVTERGDVFLYKRTTPPTNATTCSLIRRAPANGGSNSGGGYYPVQPNYPAGNSYYPSSGSATNRTSSSNSQSRRERKWRDCSLCHGKGTIVRDSYVSTYGLQDRQVYCSQCGRSYYSTTGHSHVTCPTCHGNRGFWSD